MKVVFFLLLAVSNSALGATCSFSVLREACPGKESEALAPYPGNPTLEPGFAQNEADCVAQATLKSKIVRQLVIKKITVTPTYNGTALAPVSTQGNCGHGQKKTRNSSIKEEK